VSIIYRQAVCDDISDIYKVEVACFKQPWSLESIYTDLCENEFSFYIVAEEEGVKIAGYCGIHIIVDEGHIMNVAVMPEFRKHGIGRGLLETMFMQKCLPFYTLEVRESNDAAIRLYDKLGFTVFGKRPKYYGDEDALIMWRGKSRL
jgi:ribosomal-protein-alanine N-acetyltransferase